MTDNVKRVPSVENKSAIPNQFTFPKTKYQFGLGMSGICEWEEKMPNQFSKEVSFVVENLEIRGESGPYEVRAYYIGGNGQWVIRRITTTKMFVGSDGKYKQVLPKVIFDEKMSEWTINLYENRPAVKTGLESAKQNASIESSS